MTSKSTPDCNMTYFICKSADLVDAPYSQSVDELSRNQRQRRESSRSCSAPWEAQHNKSRFLMRSNHPHGKFLHVSSVDPALERAFCLFVFLISSTESVRLPSCNPLQLVWLLLSWMEERPFIQLFAFLLTTAENRASSHL